MLFPSSREDRARLHLGFQLAAIMRRHRHAMEIFVPLLNMEKDDDCDIVCNAMIGSRVAMEAMVEQMRSFR